MSDKLDNKNKASTKPEYGKDFLEKGMHEYTNQLNELSKQIKETTKKNTEQKETKNILHNIVVDAYKILIDKIGYKVDTFKTRLEIQVLNNDIKTKKLLHDLKNEILANHATREKLHETKIEKQGHEEKLSKKSKKIENTKGTMVRQLETDIDNQSLLERIEKNRNAAAQRVQNYIASFSKRNITTGGKMFTKIFNWLEQKVK